MEAIAREAGIAKPTLYKYFSSKEDVFAAAIKRFLANMQQQVMEGLEKPGTAEEKVARALSDKYKTVFRLLENAPHGDELYGEQAQSTADEMRTFSAWFEQQLTETLEAGGKPDARKYAQLLIACADGIYKHARFVEQIGPGIRLITQKLLA